MQISHIEVRRHPIWQREVRTGRQIEGPGRAPSSRAGVIIATCIGILAVAGVLVALG